MKQYELNRKEYNKVKEMNHRQMSVFCSHIYQRGYEAGKKESADIVQALTAAQEERRA